MSNQFSTTSSIPSCPEDKYWVHPHQRIKKDKNGKTHIEQVKDIVLVIVPHILKLR
jgi:hypothetical protein